MEAISKGGKVPICVIGPNFSASAKDMELSVEAMILKTFDSLNFYEQLMVKCSATLGYQFFRQMLMYVTSSTNRRKFAAGNFFFCTSKDVICNCSRWKTVPNKSFNLCGRRFPRRWYIRVQRKTTESYGKKGTDLSVQGYTCWWWIVGKVLNQFYIQVMFQMHARVFLDTLHVAICNLDRLYFATLPTIFWLIIKRRNSIKEPSNTCNERRENVKLAVKASLRTF